MSDRGRKPVDEEAVLRDLARANPVPSSAVEGEADRAASRRILRRVMEASPQTEQRSVGRPTRWLTGILTAAAVTVGVALLALPQVRQGRTASPLEDAALAAAARPAPVVAAGEYLYVKRSVTERRTGVISDGSWTAFVPQVVEAWIAPDGSGRVLVTTGEPRFLTPRDRETWEAAGSPSLRGPVATRTYGPGELADPDLTDLPTDADELLRVLQARPRRAGVPDAATVFVLASDLLRQPLAPPDLRAALYQVIARLPGIDVLGPTTDPIGRQGVAVGITTRESGTLERWVLIFNAETSAVLAEQRLLLETDRSVDTPVPLRSNVELARATVSAIGRRPGAS
jgi:hypothetical protein